MDSNEDFPFVFKCRDKPLRQDHNNSTGETMKSAEWIPFLIRKIQEQQRQLEELRQHIAKHRTSKN
jgi:hypothetical protein